MSKSFDSWSFHRALRKCLDSKASNIVWNSIYLLQSDDWEKFCDDMERVADGSFEEKCKAALYYGEHARNLFLIGLWMLTKEEFKALEKYSYVTAVDSVEPLVDSGELLCQPAELDNHRRES